MDLSAVVASAYVDRAYDQMREVIRRVDPDQLNTRPFGPETNSIAGLVVHCTQVTEFWLGHVGVARPTARQRDLEFGTVADHADLDARIDTAVAAAHSYVERLAAGEGQPNDARVFLYGDEGDASLVLHVLEELYQHLGHMDVTADALTAG